MGDGPDAEAIEDARALGGPALVAQLLDAALDDADAAVGWDGLGEAPSGYWPAVSAAFRTRLGEHQAQLEHDGRADPDR